jgi:4a-hydroxytetrahydrobiopterin dehydratase
MINKSNLSRWQHDRANGALSRTISTDTFRAALVLANRIGDIADAIDHHPDLGVSWGRLTIRICTHDRREGDVALTERDIALAERIDREVP